jgi:hypothetical protein
MSRGKIALLLLAAVAMVAVLPAAFAGGDEASTSQKGPKERRLIAPLSGQEEQPVADPNGYGAASIRIIGRRVCYLIAARQLDTVVAGHIHKAPAGQNGDIVVPLFEGSNVDLDPSRRDCVRADSRALAKDIARNPDDYYVNIHTMTFPDGAIRGQLTR